MANELSISINVTYANPASNVAADAMIASFSVSIGGAPGAYMRNEQAATGSKADLALPLISSIGYTVLHNCDSTNSILVYHTSGASQAALLLKPGAWQVVCWAPGAAPQIQNNGSGAPLLEYYAINA